MTQPQNSVETVSRISCSVDDAWQTVCFYEHVQKKPSWFLRTVLPTPLWTTGCYGKVGDESRCQYSDGGYLAKKITGIVAGERMDFEIIEQTIRYGKTIFLRGGTIEVIRNDDESCTVRMITRYQFSTPVLTIVRPFVAFTVSAMHRFVIRDMLAHLAAPGIEFSHTY